MTKPKVKGVCVCWHQIELHGNLIGCDAPKEDICLGSGTEDYLCDCNKYRPIPPKQKRKVK